MAGYFLAPAALAVGLATAPAALAQDITGSIGESSYLTRFEGCWTGSGTAQVSSMGITVALRCDVSGQAQGDRLVIQGTCSGSGVQRKMSASLRYNPRTRSYQGSWSDGTSSAGLSGARRGGSLSLVVSETESAGEARRMTLTPQQGRFQLSLKKASDPGQPLVTIAFQRS